MSNEIARQFPWLWGFDRRRGRSRRSRYGLGRRWSNLDGLRSSSLGGATGVGSHSLPQLSHLRVSGEATLEFLDNLARFLLKAIFEIEADLHRRLQVTKRSSFGGSSHRQWSRNLRDHAGFPFS
jgi:hypothetical protein